MDTTDGQLSMDHLESLGVSDAPGIGVSPGSLEHVLRETASYYRCGNQMEDDRLLNGVRRCLISVGILLAYLPFGVIVG